MKDEKERDIEMEGEDVSKVPADADLSLIHI